MNISIKNKGSSCPCGARKSAAECCLVFISEKKHAESAEELMRSRYLAYALGKGKYIVDTWHESTRPRNLDLDKAVKWTGLKILRTSTEKNNMAYVEFVAEFNNAGVVGQMHERSRFIREEGRWYYVDGVQLESDTQHMLKKIGRNEPCGCGSGRKFKKCCGKN